MMDECDLNKKVELFRKGGADNLVIISDFDGTMTKAFREDGTTAPNSINVFRRERLLSEEYIKETTALPEKYYPMEGNPRLSFEERSQAMIEWWSKHHAAMERFGLTKSIIEKAAKSGKILLREDLDVYLAFLRDKGVPLVVFSAGLGEVIELLLLKHGGFPDDTFLVSNFSKFDEDGKFIGVKGEVIHSLNKNIESLKHHNFYDQIKDRKNVILVGDSMGDLNMVKGLECENVIKMGFFHDKGNKELEQVFFDEFDIVIEDDLSFDPLISLLLRIFNESQI